MELFLIRHAKAADLGTLAADTDRPLVAKGQRQAERIGAFLRRTGWLPDLVLTSPRRRARETAELLCQTAKLPGPVVQGWLSGGTSGEEMLRELGAFGEFKRVAVVGHEPDLSQWTAWLTTMESGCVQVKKAALVGLHLAPPARRAELRFLIPAKAIR